MEERKEGSLWYIIGRKDHYDIWKVGRINMAHERQKGSLFHMEGVVEIWLYATRNP